MSKNRTAGGTTAPTSDEEKERMIAESQRRFAMDSLQPHETPSYLINQLNHFYIAHPDYETQITDIFMMSQLMAAEFNKFIRRPHTKVTKIFLDRDNPYD